MQGNDGETTGAGTEPEAAAAPEQVLTIGLEQEHDGRWIGEVLELPGCLVYGQSPSDAANKVKALAYRVLTERMAERMESAGGAGPAEIITGPVRFQLGKRPPTVLSTLRSMVAGIAKQLKADQEVDAAFLNDVRYDLQEAGAWGLAPLEHSHEYRGALLELVFRKQAQAIVTTGFEVRVVAIDANAEADTKEVRKGIRNTTLGTVVLREWLLTEPERPYTRREEQTDG